ncbi:MAG: hypothetical protein O7E54_04210 [Planctomycetota bacterium]|nr:hypothetical protein [Planctomycetota bacterium]
MRAPLFCILLLVSPLWAQGDDLAERVQKLEEQLEAQRRRGEERSKRIAELENALQQATESLARSLDRRSLDKEIESYLESNPVDLGPPRQSRLNIGAVIVTSYRAASFSDDTPNRNSFQIDEVYLRVVYRFSESLTARYYTGGLLAELEYIHTELFRVNAGLIVVPFGQFNSRSFPDTFDTLSRPRMYLGDDELFVIPENNPRPFFRTTYSDVGFAISGSRWRNDNQLYYAVFVTNGLVGVNDLTGSAASTDNNDNKQVGARLAYTVGSLWEQTRAGLGLSWMNGKYDAADSLSYRMYGIDFILVADGLFKQGEGSLTIRAEYVYGPRETLYPDANDPNTLINDANRVHGAYLLVEMRLDRTWMVYFEIDWMRQEGPLLTNGSQVPDTEITSTNWRPSVGVVYRFEIGILWKLEYAYWDFDQGAPDIQTVATQLVVPF